MTIGRRIFALTATLAMFATILFFLIFFLQHTFFFVTIGRRIFALTATLAMFATTRLKSCKCAHQVDNNFLCAHQVNNNFLLLV